jgi:hypothetical protein
MSDPFTNAWFAGRPGRILLYRVNRRPKYPDTLMPATLPGDAFEHFIRTLEPDRPVVLGRRYQLEWRVGGLIGGDNALTGRLGRRPLDVKETSTKYVPERRDWIVETIDPKEKHLLPFGFDGESRLLAVVTDGSASPTTIGTVFEKILRENEAASTEPTTDWSVEPILDRQDFLDWLQSLEIVSSVSFTVRYPNPAPRAPHEDLADRLKKAHATQLTQTFRSKLEEGLVGVAEDQDVKQAISLAQEGSATLSGRGKRAGKRSIYSQKESQAAESVESMPHTWDQMRDALIDRLRGPLRRFKDDQQ